MDTDLVIRTLSTGDLDRLVRMDQPHSGRNRTAFYEGKLRRALDGSDVRISLGAERDGFLVGAVLGSVQYGEFGVAEPVAILDTILVDTRFAGQGVGRALLAQLLENLEGLRIERIRTELSWEESELLGFLRQVGFTPVPRLVLERATEGRP